MVIIDAHMNSSLWWQVFRSVCFFPQKSHEMGEPLNKFVENEICKLPKYLTTLRSVIYER